jgi:hypothetical protein
MAMIHVQVGNNFIEDVFLNGGSKVNIITNKLRVQLGLSKPKPTPYNLHTVDQTMAKPLGLIKDLKILAHGILYAITFIMVQSSVLDSIYFMLLGHPWLKDAKVSHNWGNNTITIQGSGTIKIIQVTKKLGAPTKRPKVLVCYDFNFEISDKEKDLMFATYLKVFSIGTIAIPISIRLKQPIDLISSIGFNLIEQVFDVLVEPIYVLHV